MSRNTSLAVILLVTVAACGPGPGSPSGQDAGTTMDGGTGGGGNADGGTATDGGTTPRTAARAPRSGSGPATPAPCRWAT